VTLDSISLKLLFVFQVADDLFSCHSHSALLHPVGWAQSVGHRLEASEGRLRIIQFSLISHSSGIRTTMHLSVV